MIRRLTAFLLATVLPVALAASSFLFFACMTDKDPEKGEVVENLSLIQEYAGARDVSATLQGTHARGTVIIGADGSVDFDTGLSFAPADYMDVYDRLFVTDSYGGPRIQVEIKPSGALPQRRLRIFVDTAAGEVVKVAYYPDAASDAGVVVEVGAI